MKKYKINLLKVKNIKILFFCLFVSIIISLLLDKRYINSYTLIPLDFFSLLLFCYGNNLLSNLAIGHYPREKYKYKHLIIQLPLSIILSFTILVSHEYIIILLSSSSNKISFDFLLLLSFVFSIFIVTLSEGTDFFRHWKEYIIHAEKVEKANLLAQYESLRNQVNPHFLFNGLTTLISFIENKDVRAAAFAQSLSDFLKYLLTYHKDELITLEQELSVVNQYIYLQMARFEKNLVVEINISENLKDNLLPPLSLQILVENAIKHNKISYSNILKIEIYEENDYIFVKNNKQLIKNVNSAKVGIDNITGRYRLFTKKEIIKADDNINFLIGIPLIKDH